MLESLVFSARLRLPESVTKAQLTTFVNEVSVASLGRKVIPSLVLHTEMDLLAPACSSSRLQLR